MSVLSIFYFLNNNLNYTKSKIIIWGIVVKNKTEIFHLKNKEGKFYYVGNKMNETFLNLSSNK